MGPIYEVSQQHFFITAPLTLGSFYCTLFELKIFQFGEHQTADVSALYLQLPNSSVLPRPATHVCVSGFKIPPGDLHGFPQTLHANIGTLHRVSPLSHAFQS